MKGNMVNRFLYAVLAGKVFNGYVHDGVEKLRVRI
jgi:hypothetical protein